MSARGGASACHVLGLLALLVGLAIPWLALDPLADRADRLQRLEATFSGDRLPAFMREPLVERGYQPGLAPERLRELLSGGEEGAARHFELLEGREQVYAWDFWRVPAGGVLRLAGLLAGVVALAALVILLARLGAADSPPAGRAAAKALGLFAFGVALLVILATPQADTFGLVGSGDAAWGASWLDVLTGAEVTVAPRALVPIGLLLLAAAQLLYFIDWESRPSDESYD